MDWWKVIGLISPFVSAFLAAWITNAFATKRVKAGKFLDERLNALRNVHAELVAAKLYFSKSVSREQGDEHGIWPEQGQHSQKIQKNLWECFQANAIFLSENERELILDLMKQMDMCNAMERAIQNDEQLRAQSNTIEIYEKLALMAAEAMVGLYLDLKNEYGI